MKSVTKPSGRRRKNIISVISCCGWSTPATRVDDDATYMYVCQIRFTAISTELYTQRGGATTNTARRCGLSGRRRSPPARSASFSPPTTCRSHIIHQHYDIVLYRSVSYIYCQLSSAPHHDLKLDTVTTRCCTAWLDLLTRDQPLGPTAQHAEDGKQGAERSRNIRNAKVIYNLQIHSKQHFWDKS